MYICDNNEGSGIFLISSRMASASQYLCSVFGGTIIFYPGGKQHWKRKTGSYKTDKELLCITVETFHFLKMVDGQGEGDQFK